MPNPHAHEEDPQCLPILHVYQSRDPSKTIVVGCCCICGAITVGIYESKFDVIEWLEPDGDLSLKLSMTVLMEWMGKNA